MITKGFEWQRTGKVEETARREDEEIRERTDEGLPRLPAEEIDKMIQNIRREMLEVAKKQEYERAAQLRDRIRELEEYKNESKKSYLGFYYNPVPELYHKASKWRWYNNSRSLAGDCRKTGIEHKIPSCKCKYHRSIC
ncbi:MAG: hypothetical protein DRO65_02985 [Candidatus Altiarchaeales archaeon]|nr:MAG: hypothetical protein DRO65_02985 [Candidatus Altiarchaeales archaeon]